MKKLKYIKLFENFQFQYFKPEDIQKLNDDLYNEEFDDINLLLEHWIEEIAKVIKSIEPFKNIEEMEVDSSKYGSIKVDWNEYCRPFTIDFSSFARTLDTTDENGVYERYEGICIGFITEGPNGEDPSYPDVEDLSTMRYQPYTAGMGGNSIEYHFQLGDSISGKFHDALRSSNWYDEGISDGLMILFRNIEKSVYK
jgi:hypothetical protein